MLMIFMLTIIAKQVLQKRSYRVGKVLVTPVKVNKDKQKVLFPMELFC